MTKKQHSNPIPPPTPRPKPILTITNLQKRHPVNQTRIRQLLEFLGEKKPLHLKELGIVLIGPKKMASIHRRFLGEAGPTDVLTFRHGEILVCPHVAAKQAKFYKQKFSNELFLYIIHGWLHLYGMDDHHPTKARAMVRTQTTLLKKFLCQFRRFPSTVRKMKHTLSLFTCALTFLTHTHGAYIYLNEPTPQASPAQYQPNIEFEVCIPKQFPELLLQDGVDKGEVWCHNFTGWIRVRNDPGGWLDITGLNLGFSFQTWTVWDYATALVVAVRQKDFERLKNMSDEAAQQNLQQLLQEEGPNSVTHILQQATDVRAFCHIRKNDIEWLFLEVYFPDRLPTMMALSLRKKDFYHHQFIDAKIQDYPAIFNSFRFFNFELVRLTHLAQQKRTQEAKLGEKFFAPDLGATLRESPTNTNSAIPSSTPDAPPQR